MSKNKRKHIVAAVPGWKAVYADPYIRGAFFTSDVAFWILAEGDPEVKHDCDDIFGVMAVEGYMDIEEEPVTTNFLGYLGPTEDLVDRYKEESEKYYDSEKKKKMEDLEKRAKK